MTKTRSQQLSEKADEEELRRRDWLLPLMQNQPKFLTRNELRSAVIRDHVSKLCCDFGWIIAIEDTDRYDAVGATAPTTASQGLPSPLHYHAVQVDFAKQPIGHRYPARPRARS